MATRPTNRTGARRRRPTAASPSPRREWLVYVYCVVQSPSAPRAGRVPGLPEASPPRAVSIGRSRWLLLADVPAAHFGDAALAAGLKDLDWVGTCAMAHDALVMEAMQEGPVVPMRLFTIFEDEARARSHALAAASRIGRTLRRVAGRAEYGVRIAFRRPTRPGVVARRPLTGRAFLEQKRAQLASRASLTAVSAGERRRVVDRLAAAADDMRHRPIPDGASPVWLDSAFLVTRRRAAAFEREVRRLSAELQRAGHDIVLTGPWPPYSFVEERASRS